MTGKIGAALALAAILALSGCAERVDLINEWPAMAEPTGWEPKAGACSSIFAETTTRAAYKTEDCSVSHLYETVHIGQFTGDAALAATPPASGSTAMRAAWAECDTKTTEFLGGEWRGGWVSIAVSVPSTGNWEGGARWFRCEVAQWNQDMTARESHSKSLKGEFAAASPLKFGCIKRTSSYPIQYKACTEAHDVEFVGVYTASESFDEANKNPDSIHRRCRSLIAAYVGVPDDGNMKYRTGTWYWVMDRDQWDAGDHGIRCHLLLNKDVTRSLKGGGTKALPINYA